MMKWSHYEIKHDHNSRISWLILAISLRSVTEVCITLCQNLIHPFVLLSSPSSSLASASRVLLIYLKSAWISFKGSRIHVLLKPWTSFMIFIFGLLIRKTLQQSKLYLLHPRVLLATISNEKSFLDELNLESSNYAVGVGGNEIYQKNFQLETLNILLNFAGLDLEQQKKRALNISSTALLCLFTSESSALCFKGIIIESMNAINFLECLKFT